MRILMQQAQLRLFRQTRNVSTRCLFSAIHSRKVAVKSATSSSIFPVAAATIMISIAVAASILGDRQRVNISECSSAAKTKDAVDQYKIRTGLNDTTKFQRLDEEYLTKPAFLRMSKDNVFHDTLKGEGMIEIYEVYRKLGDDEIYALVRFGHRLNGHPSVVHGGITSTAFDNTFGWLFFALGVPSAFTAYLHVNFRYTSCSTYLCC